jgi:hypothetical protein
LTSPRDLTEPPRRNSRNTGSQPSDGHLRAEGRGGNLARSSTSAVTISVESGDKSITIRSGRPQHRANVTICVQLSPGTAGTPRTYLLKELTKTRQT